MDQNNYRIAAVRRLLIAAFVQEDLVRFCHDRDSFRYIVEHIPPNCSLVQTVDIVLRQCETKGQILDLLSEVKNYNPKQYDNFGHELFVLSKAVEQKSFPETEALQQKKETPEWPAPDQTPPPTKRSMLRDLWDLIPKLGKHLEQIEWHPGLDAIRQFHVLNHRMAIVGTKRCTSLLDLSSQQKLWQLDFAPEHIAVAGNRRSLALANKQEVILVDLEKGRRLGSSLAIQGGVKNMVFAPRESQLALQCLDESVELRDVSDWKVVQTFKAPPEPVILRSEELDRRMASLLEDIAPSGNARSIAFSHNGLWLASTMKGQVGVWPAPKTTPMRWLGPVWPKVYCIAFAHNDATIALGCHDGEVFVYKMANEELVHTLIVRKKAGLSSHEDSPITHLAFSPGGEILAASVNRRKRADLDFFRQKTAEPQPIYSWFGQTVTNFSECGKLSAWQRVLL